MPRPGHRAGRAQWAQWALAAVLLLGVFTTWSLATARYGGPDEPGHVLRAAAAGRGELLGHPVAGLVDGFRAVRVPAALATGDPRCFRHDQRRPATCAVATAGVTGVRVAASSAGTNPPWYSLAVGVPVRLVGDAAQVLWYRLVAASWCAAAFAAALVRARDGARLGVLLAIAPAAWFLGGVVNPNALEIPLAALAWVGVARTIDGPGPPSGSDLAWISVPTALAILIRPIAAVETATMLAVLVVAAVVPRRRGWLHRRAWLAVGAPLALAVAATLLWNRWSDVVVRDVRAATSAGVVERTGDAFAGVRDTVRELAGSLGWAEFSTPWPLQLVWWSAVACAGLLAWRAGGARRLSWLAVAASVVALPVVFEIALAGRLGFIWQGRYSIPTAIGLVILGPRRWLGRRWWAAGAVLAEIGALWATLRRYTVGTNGSWLLRDQRWHPAVPPFVLLALNAVVITALAVWATAGDSLSAPRSVRGLGHLLAHHVEC